MASRVQSSERVPERTRVPDRGATDYRLCRSQTTLTRAALVFLLIAAGSTACSHGHQDADSKPAPIHILGRVLLRSGEPASDAQVILVHQPDLPWTRIAGRTDSSGRYRLVARHGTPSRVVTWKNDVGASVSGPLSQTENANQLIASTLELRGDYSVSGRVLLTDGFPGANMRVWVDATHLSEETPPPVRCATDLDSGLLWGTTTSNDDGLFGLHGLAPAVFSVRVGQTHAASRLVGLAQSSREQEEPHEFTFGGPSINVVSEDPLCGYGQPAMLAVYSRLTGPLRGFRTHRTGLPQLQRIVDALVVEVSQPVTVPVPTPGSYMVQMECKEGHIDDNLVVVQAEHHIVEHVARLRRPRARSSGTVNIRFAGEWSTYQHKVIAALRSMTGRGSVVPDFYVHEGDSKKFSDTAPGEYYLSVEGQPLHRFSRHQFPPVITSRPHFRIEPGQSMEHTVRLSVCSRISVAVDAATDVQCDLASVYVRRVDGADALPAHFELNLGNREGLLGLLPLDGSKHVSSPLVPAKYDITISAHEAEVWQGRVELEPGIVHEIHVVLASRRD